MTIPTLPDVPLVLCYGPNGSGKSTAIRAHLRDRGMVYGGRAFQPPEDLAWAAGELAADPGVLADVASLYAALSPPLTLTIGKDYSAHHRPRVASHERPDQERFLCDHGDGLARLLLRATGATSAVRWHCPHGIEYPERDLHGDNAAAFAQYLVRLAARPGARLIVETHDQVFATAAQLAVAKGEIPADAVRIVEFDRFTTREITLSPWGDLTSDGTNPHRAILKMVMERSRVIRARPDFPRRSETP